MHYLRLKPTPATLNGVENPTNTHGWETLGEKQKAALWADAAKEPGACMDKNRIPFPRMGETRDSNSSEGTKSVPSPICSREVGTRGTIMASPLPSERAWPCGSMRSCEPGLRSMGLWWAFSLNHTT